MTAPRSAPQIERELADLWRETFRKEHLAAVATAQARYTAQAASACLAYRDLFDAARAARRAGVFVEDVVGPDLPHLHGTLT